MNDHRPDTEGAGGESAGGHRYSVRVYYEDTDAGGVVYHANYLRFAERARTEALRAAMVPHADMTSLHGVMFMVRRLKVDYLAPARLDDSLLVVTRPLLLRGASVELRQSIYRPAIFRAAAGEAAGEGRPLVVLEVLLACVRVADQRPGRVPERWRVALMSLS